MIGRWRREDLPPYSSRVDLVDKIPWMRALSIRQPFAELILQGIKTIEYRSRATQIIGERFWIYAARKKCRFPNAANASPGAEAIWSVDLSSVTPPPWIAELANGMRLFPHELPTGVIVGSAIIERCTPLPMAGNRATRMFQWHLTGVERVRDYRKPTGRPQPVWFQPF